MTRQCPAPKKNQRFCLSPASVDGADVAPKPLNVADQERCEARAAAVRPLGARGVEGELARAVLVARHAQVVGAPNVGPELDGVVAQNLRPVVDELKLLFVLVERAVAAVHAERVAEFEKAVAVAVDEERGHAAGEIVEFSRVCRRPRRARARPFGGHENLIAEQAEPKIGEKGRPHT